MLRVRGVNPAVRSWDKSALSRAKQRIARENTGTRRRAGRHIFRPHGLPLPKVAGCNACVLDMHASGQARDFNGCPRWCIAKLKTARVSLIHDPHWNFPSQIGIYENHIAEFKSSSLYD